MGLDYRSAGCEAALLKKPYPRFRRLIVILTGQVAPTSTDVAALHHLMYAVPQAAPITRNVDLPVICADGPLEVTVSRGVLVFDGRCGFCTRTVGWLRRLDRHRRVELLPLQQPGAPERVGATVDECLISVRWQGTDSSRAAAAEAINAALAAALGTRAPLLVYRLTRRAQEWLYQWIANNRYRLPGATPWCERYPADCTKSSGGPQTDSQNC
jgi:predicted DCC family thiol-disulfide oxidoreductase YuxK